MKTYQFVRGIGDTVSAKEAVTGIPISGVCVGLWEDQYHNRWYAVQWEKADGGPTERWCREDELVLET